ncbi:MAG: BsaWI family type II restriction enzyme [bacterium]
MNLEDLLGLYKKYKDKYGSHSYKYMSKLLREAKEIHKKDWLKKPTPGKDHEQSWKAFKGKNLEKLIIHIIKEEVEQLGLKIVRGDTLEKTQPKNLSKELSTVKRRVCVDFGEYGLHLPDADIIIYEPEKVEIIAILSSKSTLRERIAETGYWKIKLLQDSITKNIRVLFITPDEDGDLTIKCPAKKSRAICEIDTDGTYVMSETDLEESGKVKSFDKFIVDLKSYTKLRSRQ